MNEGLRNLFVRELSLLNDIFPKDGDIHDGLQLADGASASRHVVVTNGRHVGVNSIAALAGNADGYEAQDQDEHDDADNNGGTIPQAASRDAVNEVVHTGALGCPACPPTGEVCGAFGANGGHVLPGAPVPPVRGARPCGLWRSMAHSDSELARVLLAVHQEDDEEPPMDPFAGISLAPGGRLGATASAAAAEPETRRDAASSHLPQVGEEEPNDEDLDGVSPATQEQIAQWRAYRAANRRGQAE